MNINFNQDDDPLKGLFGDKENKPDPEDIVAPETPTPEIHPLQPEENPLDAFFNLDSPEITTPKQPVSPFTPTILPSPAEDQTTQTFPQPPQAPQESYNPPQQPTEAQYAHEPTIPMPSVKQSPPPQHPTRPDFTEQETVTQEAKPASKPAKKGVKVAPKKSNYAGKRKQLLLYRIFIITVLAIVGLTGLQSMFFGGKGPTKEQLAEAILDQTGLNKFPVEAGKQFAIDFTKTYFTYRPNDSDSLALRSRILKQYAHNDLLRIIDVNFIEEAEDDNNGGGEPPEGLFPDEGNAPTSSNKSVTYGPFVVKYKVVSPSYAVFTLKMTLSGSSQLVYYDVPVKYDADNLTITLAAPPTFTINPENFNPDSLRPTDYNLDIPSPDHVLGNALQSDIETFMRAWAASEPTIINRYISDDATPNARIGLKGAVEYQKLVALTIESYNETYPITETERFVEITVQWKLPNGLLVSQKYHSIIVKNSADKWVIWDIKNFTETILDN